MGRKSISHVTLLLFMSLETLSHVKKRVTLNPKFVTFDFCRIHINQRISRLANLMSGQLHIIIKKNTHP